MEDKKEEIGKKETNKPTEDATPDDEKGGKYETTPLIERAREEREKLEEANQKKEELLNREEQIMAKRALGGDSEAGQTAEKKEETPAEYTQRIQGGEGQ